MAELASCRFCKGTGDFAEQEYVMTVGKPSFTRFTGRQRKCLICDGTGLDPLASAENPQPVPSGAR